MESTSGTLSFSHPKNREILSYGAVYADGLLDSLVPAEAAPKAHRSGKFEDMVANATQSVVLILVY